MVAERLLCGLLLLLSIPADDGTPVFQPSFIYMTGTTVTASLTNSSANGFFLSVTDSVTGLFPPTNCSDQNQTGDWILNVTYQENVARVTVRLAKSLQLCTSNVTDCCSEELCVVEALQVLACRDSAVVARLVIQAQIYVNTSLGNLTGKGEDNATVIPNQAFQPLGPCPCDLTAGACDIRCCCDSECSPETKDLFKGSCFPGVFGGDVNPPFDQLCSTERGNSAPDWFPFLCVQSSLSNTPFLGYFYDGAISSSQVSSLEIPIPTVPGKLTSGYRQGDPILTLPNGYFTVPQPFAGGHCARNAPVAFLRDFESRCVTTCDKTESLRTSTAVNSGFGDSIKIQVKSETRSTDVSGCPGRECHGVSFSEEYTIIWEGMKIVEMKVAVVSGDLCPGEALVQKFTVSFISVNATSTEELSGNPGYQLGKPIRAANLNSSDDITTLKMWKPDGGGLCTSASLRSLSFGVNSVSGCILEVDLNDNCSQLREKVAESFNTLVEATYVGKRGNSNASVPEDWVEIIRLEPPSPSANGSSGDLKGICLDVPAHLNIQIITADVGAVEGVPQEEILGVQTSFSTVTWQIQCPIICEDKVSSLPISVAVQFIKIPAQPPVPKTRFQINYTEYDCQRNDVCWPELFYPLTRYYTGEPYGHILAKGLMLAFFILIVVLLSNPWRTIFKALSYP